MIWIIDLYLVDKETIDISCYTLDLYFNAQLFRKAIGNQIRHALPPHKHNHPESENSGDEKPCESGKKFIHTSSFRDCPRTKASSILGIILADFRFLLRG